MNRETLTEKRAIRFIEKHAPRDERSFQDGGWSMSFYDPCLFCDGLKGRLGAAWRRAKAKCQGVKMKFKIYWISEDKQGSMYFGLYDTQQQAQGAIESSKKELLSEALPDGEGDGLMTKSAVEAGSWSVEEVADDAEDRE